MRQNIRGVESTAYSNLHNQFDFYISKLKEVNQLSKDIKQTVDDTDGSYSKIGSELSKLKDKMQDELANKKGISNTELSQYYNLKYQQKGIDDYFSSIDKGINKELKNSSLNTANLSGAEGGLNQAKVININFNSGSAIQSIKVDSSSAGSAIKSEASQAVNVIIRSLNNLTYSATGTM